VKSFTPNQVLPADDSGFFTSVALEQLAMTAQNQLERTGRIGIRVGEALVAGGPPGTAAEPEVAIGEMDGPFGTAFANLLGDQTAGHSRVLALLNTDVMVRPPTICVSKVTVTNEKYTNILMGTVQYATAMGVLDAVRSGDIPRDKADELGIIVSVWLNPAVATIKDLDHKILFDIHRKATSLAIHKAMAFQPSIDWLLENQDKVIHKYFEKGLKGEI
jgi:5,6,7,8-tetrahydromethanopterin hydro-lyase